MKGILLIEERSLINHEKMLTALIATAHQGDISFADVHQAAAELLAAGEGHSVQSMTLQLVEELLGRGLIPVSSPFAEVPGAPWANGTNEVVLDKIEQAFHALPGEPNFMDVCWVRDRYR